MGKYYSLLSCFIKSYGYCVDNFPKHALINSRSFPHLYCCSSAAANSPLNWYKAHQHQKYVLTDTTFTIITPFLVNRQRSNNSLTKESFVYTSNHLMPVATSQAQYICIYKPPVAASGGSLYISPLTINHMSSVL